MELSCEFRCCGVEIIVYYCLIDDWILDLEYVYIDVEFVGNDVGGNYVFGVINDVL